MTYFCTNCGEEESFYITHEITEYVTEDELIDAEGDTINYDNHEVSDSEVNSSENPKCGQCDRTVTNYTGEGELIEAKERYKETHKKQIRERDGIKNWKEVIEAP